MAWLMVNGTRIEDKKQIEQELIGFFAKLFLKEDLMQ